MESMENANAEKHYKLLVVAIAIGILGVFIRFAGDENSTYFSTIANIALVNWYPYSFKSCFAIMK
jgi:hypothetical protein